MAALVRYYPQDDTRQMRFASAAHGIAFADAPGFAASMGCAAMLTFNDRGFARRAAKLRLRPAVKVPGK